MHRHTTTFAHRRAARAARTVNLLVGTGVSPAPADAQTARMYWDSRWAAEADDDAGRCILCGGTSEDLDLCAECEAIFDDE